MNPRGVPTEDWGYDRVYCAFDHEGDAADCSPQMERHHIVPKQTIKGQYSYWHGLTAQARQEKGLPATLPWLEEALLDERNLLVLCRRHHELVSGHRIYVTASMLPEGIYDWAETIGVVWYLQRWFEERVA